VFRNRPVSVALVTLFLWLTGCSAYKVITPDQIGDHGSIRVTLRNGQKATIHGARFEGDSIVGWDDRHDYIGRGAYSLIQVSKIEAPDPDGISTGGYILGVLILVGLATYAVVECDNDEDCNLLDYLFDESDESEVYW